MPRPRDKSRSYLASIRLRRDRIAAFDRYPFHLPFVRTLDTLELTSPVTFFVGENGSGKSTLLEAIAVASGMNPDGGGRNFAFSTRESHSCLADYLTLSRTSGHKPDAWFLRAESIFNVAKEVDRLGVVGSYGGRSLHEQSHGESFFAIMQHRFTAGGVYFLDEPEAALSPMRQLACLRLMHELVGKNAQFIIATHSPILMAYPNATIFVFGPDGLVQTPYQSTEHFTVTRAFLDRPDRSLKELLASESLWADE
jgi:predicted ATPase